MGEALITRKGGYGDVEGGRVKVGYEDYNTAQEFSITGLGFRPAHIIITTPVNVLSTKTVNYFEWLSTGGYLIRANTSSSSSETTFTGDNFETDATCKLTVTDDGFSVKVYNIDTNIDFFYDGCLFRCPIYWIAYEEIQENSEYYRIKG